MSLDAYLTPPESPYLDDEIEAAYQQIVSDRLYMGWDIEDAEADAADMAEERCRVNRDIDREESAQRRFEAWQENRDDC